MIEKQVFKNVRLALTEMLKYFDAPDDLKIVRAYNITQQGREEYPTLYMARHLSRPRGSPKDYTGWDENKKEMVYTSKQTIELTISFQAVIPAPCSGDLRPGDILDLTSRVLQTSLFIRKLHESKMQILRIAENQHTFIINDRDQYEAVPLLQAVFVYTQTLTGTQPKISRERYRITRV